MKPPRYGTVRAVHEWKVAGRWILAALVAVVLLQAAVRCVGDGRADPLRACQLRILWLIGIDLVVAGSCTLFPERER